MENKILDLLMDAIKTNDLDKQFELYDQAYHLMAESTEPINSDLMKKVVECSFENLNNQFHGLALTGKILAIIARATGAEIDPTKLEYVPVSVLQ